MYKIIGGDRKEYGPVSAEEMRRWIGEGRLNGQSLALEEGATQWRPLVSFPEFADALRAQAGGALPSSSTPMPPGSAQTWTEQLLAVQPQLRIGQCLQRSWKLLIENFGLLFGATFVVWLIATICAFVPFGFGWLLYYVLQGVLYGGLYLVFLKRVRGQPATFGDAFSGFNIAFGQLVLVGLVTGLLTGIGLVCCLVIPGIYLFVAWKFSVPLVADRRLEFWSAMELSRKVVNRVWFEVLALLLLAFLPSILMYLFIEVKISMSMMSVMQDLMSSGRPDFSRMVAVGLKMAKTSFPLMMLWKLVVLLNLPFALGALMYAYEDLFSARSAPAP